MASAGIGFLKVSRLKDMEFDAQRYKTSEIELGNVTEKVFKGSFFLSISYNITNRQDVK